MQLLGIIMTLTMKLSGKIEFGVDDQVLIAGPGDLVNAGPKVHRRFTALEDSHMLVINSPAGPSEGFLREISTIKLPPSAEDIIHYATAYGIHIVDK